MLTLSQATSLRYKRQFWLNMERFLLVMLVESNLKRKKYSQIESVEEYLITCS